MHNYVSLLIVYTIVVSIVDFYSNDFYNKVWKKKSFKEKIGLVFFLLFHNVLYYLIYFTLFFIIYYYKSVKIKYIAMYLALLIIVPLHWYTNNNKCWFTVQQNKLLEISEDYGFRDPYLVFTNTHSSGAGSGTIRDKIYCYYLFSSIIITSVMLFLKSNKRYSRKLYKLFI